MLAATWLALFLFCFATNPARAQSPEELNRVEKELSAQKAQAASLDKKEKAAVRDLSGLKERLIAATAALQAKQAEQDRLEEKLESLEGQLTNRAAKLESSRARLSLLAAALLRLVRLPPILYFFRDPAAPDPVHRVILLRSLLPRLKEDTVVLAREIDGLESLRAEAAAQKKLVAEAAKTLEAQRVHLDQLVQTRQGMLQKTAAQKEAIARQLAALTDEAKDLHQLMDKVSAPQGVLKVPPKASLRPAYNLKLPVGGRITHNYGSKDEYGVASQGVSLSAAPGSPVVAPKDGKVVFAGPFRGYGQIVILQHKDGYHSFLSGFARIDAEMGQNLAAGEPLGVLPASGKPEIYFEWRHNGEPIDPMISTGVKSVSQRDTNG